MKRLLLIIFILRHIVVYSQNTSNYTSRAEHGDLSYEECMAVAYENIDAIVPSLMKLKTEYSSAFRYDGERYTNVVSLLDNYYYRIGDFVSSKHLLDEAVEVIRQREYQQNSKYNSILLVCRGRLEYMLTDYAAALTYYKMAQKCFEDVNDYGEAYMTLLFNMAIAYQASGDLLSAKIYMDEAVENYESRYGSILETNDVAYYLYIVDYGAVCESVGHMEEAEKCFLAIINKCKDNNIDIEAYALALNNLSTMYVNQGRWSEAAILLENIESVNEDKKYLFAQNRCLCNLYSGQFAKATEALDEMNGTSLECLKRIFASMPQQERESYWIGNSRERVFVNNLVANKIRSAKSIGIAYNNALFTKNMLIDFSRIVDKLVAVSNDNGLIQKYNSYKKLRQSLSYKSNIGSRDSLVNEIKNTEQRILADISVPVNKIEGADSWQEVKNLLADDEIAIEFCYVPTMEKIPQVCSYYGAFILRKNFDSPQLVQLAELNSVENILNVASINAMAINRLYTERADTLRQMLWQKLKPYMKGVKTVYYAPTGLLSNFNFDALTDDDGRMLGEKYSMVRLSSTANIPKVKMSGGLLLQSAVLYGNIAYDELVEDMAAASEKCEMFTGEPIQRQLSLRSENERGRWGDISSTKKEIDNIKTILRNDGVEVTAFEGTQASEESFKAMSGKSPDVIHLATHGFAISTLQQAKGNKFTSSVTLYAAKDYGMIWTGLILAGGNNVWQGKFNMADVEDGVLTADEISRLDLSHTKLVVLSACETGKGEIDPIDGVYGLQRAFKMAGAGTIVMSLWQVQDDATSLLMTRFYAYLASGQEKRRALWRAMMDVKARYHDPYYWAGFVMLE